jgi:hypothetical protein
MSLSPSTVKQWAKSKVSYHLRLPLEKGMEKEGDSFITFGEAGRRRGARRERGRESSEKVIAHHHW